MAASALGLFSGLCGGHHQNCDRVSLPTATTVTICSSRVSSASTTGPARVRLRHIRAVSSQQVDAGSTEPSPSSSAVEPGPPTIDLEFLGPEPGPDGIPRVDSVSVISGDKLLRTVMNDQKLELYGLYGKIMNCGGGGSCGTCIVEILEGRELLNDRTDAEDRYLKKNPKSWRLACQTIVGNKSNFGKVVVQRLPQKKK